MSSALALAFVAVLAGCGGCGGDGGGGGGDGGGDDDDDGGGNGGPDAGGVVVDYTCARELHVSPSGNDGNDGSAAKPFRTIAHATPLAEAGDCVKVHAGTYKETETIGFAGDGTATAPIVVWSVDGRGAAIIDSANLGGGPAVLVQNDYIYLDGFEFKNMATDGGEQVVHFDGRDQGKAKGAVLRNSKVTGGYDHIKINEQTGGVIIEHNEFYGEFGHLPISLTGASGLVFRYNYAHDWNTGGDGAIQLKGGSRDVVFEGNRFEDITNEAGVIALGDTCESTCDIDPEHYAAVNVKVVNNVLIRVGRAFDLQGCKDCAILCNTIVDSGQGNVLVKLTQATTNGVTRTTVNARILDNLIVNTKGDQGNVLQVNPGSGQGLQLDYNLAWNGGSGVEWGDGVPGGANAHGLEADPKLVAPATGDVSLAADSPARKAGMNLFGEVPKDHAGTARPASGPFDIGAIQMP